MLLRIEVIVLKIMVSRSKIYISRSLEKSIGERDQRLKINASILLCVAYTLLQTIIFWNNIEKQSNVTGGVFLKKLSLLSKGEKNCLKEKMFPSIPKGILLIKIGIVVNIRS